MAGENHRRPTSRGHMTDKLLTQRQLADELEVSLRTLERWRQQGTGPAFIRVGRSPRYRRSDIDAWLERQRRTGDE
jgi:excisionase family DNA binding protein